MEENGVEYLCDYTADDHPFRFNTPQNNLIAVPYTVELNDIPAFLETLRVGVSSEAFGDMIVDQFDVLYEDATNARCMPICLHTFHVGHKNKFKHLKRAFEYITSMMMSFFQQEMTLMIGMRTIHVKHRLFSQAWI